MKAIKCAAIVLCLLCASPSLADDVVHQSMTVDEAYRAIPHNKTRFDAAAATMAATEKQFLDIFFGLTDLAVAEKVIRQNGRDATDNYDAILGKLAALEVPEKMEKAHRLVTEAVQEQRQYLQGREPGEGFNAGNALVQSSHGKLLAAYNELMRAYPEEGSHNKKAFFDHLCALDFI